MKKERWVWMPHAGHFILGHRCQFKLNTYVGGYIVSTIGELWNEQWVRRIHAEVFDVEWYAKNKDKIGDTFDRVYMEKFGHEDVGLDRKYETMVFPASKSQHSCCPYEMNGDELDFDAYNRAEDAFRGHYRLCKKWAGR